MGHPLTDNPVRVIPLAPATFTAPAPPRRASLLRGGGASLPQWGARAGPRLCRWGIGSARVKMNDRENPVLRARLLAHAAPQGIHDCQVGRPGGRFATPILLTVGPGGDKAAHIQGCFAREMVCVLVREAA